MSEDFPIPAKAQSEAKASERKAEAPRPRRFPRRGGFICGYCKCAVDFYVRGDHKPDCPNAEHNESLHSAALSGDTE